ncbi:MAG: phosphoribosyltransferase [Candidatus Obscuribacter sp.]|nr:phosphoribosyltransferase [Candidatus Obscuribacter sp.]MBK9278511.1 phosphoribosyltransferase [Candidatus Obscuribacter sp.]MBL8082507.1 hypothetical protein [Candidatus Obscuribacter sp.]
MQFLNRTDAGVQLAERLANTLRASDFPAPYCIIALPRGGVPVGLEVARRFGTALEIIESKKLPYPGQPEFAIGAVSADGVIVLNNDIPGQDELNVQEKRKWHNYIEQQRTLLLDMTSKAEAQFYRLAGRRKASLKGKTVIIVDDGIATGMTALAAVETARKQGAAKVFLAAPVMSKESMEELKPHCDSIVTLSMPDPFCAVGLYYQDFSQTRDEEVVQALRDSTGFAATTSQAL